MTGVYLIVEISYAAMIAAMVILESCFLIFRVRFGSLLRLSFFSTLTFLEGLLLLIKFGSILDHGSELQKAESFAYEMHYFGDFLAVLGMAPAIFFGLRALDRMAEKFSI